MSDPGLTHRLRQRSRRAGLMIGISMVLTIALCAVGFTVIYTALEGFTSDFISETEVVPTAPAESEVIAQDNPDDAAPPATEAPEQNQQNSNEPQNIEDESDSQPEPDDADPNPVPTLAGNDDGEEDDDDFDPDYQLQGVTVNLRAGPSTSTSIVTALPPSTALEYLGEDAPTDSPADGDRWMMFETEDGVEGWIREIDVTDYEP